jgi:hypothetical protein
MIDFRRSLYRRKINDLKMNITNKRKYKDSVVLVTVARYGQREMDIVIAFNCYYFYITYNL